MKRNVFIIGSKGIPAKYGGFESFVEKLTKKQVSQRIHYFVACRRDLSENKADEYEYNGATCYNVSVPEVGPAKAILYDILAFKLAIKKIKQQHLPRPIVYVLACRMGPFIAYFKQELKKFDGLLLVNPDGHEWLRAKWSYPVRKYWKYSEKLMVKNADLLICDSKNIEKYIQNSYKKYRPQSIYISYGSDISKPKIDLKSSEVKMWYKKFGIRPDNYFLIVGRFVPENNYESMIREFMKSHTEKDLVIITNVKKNKFYKKLLDDTRFDRDKRVKFVGTVYDQELLKVIREQAFAYIHGHEVGGTNPSLLEALAATSLNLLLDVGFNKEVGGDGALYWQKDRLSTLIDEVERLSEDKIAELNQKSTNRIIKFFSWESIVDKYEKCFLEGIS